MDPLSLTASIIAVLGAGGTIINTLEKAKLIQQAPEIILSLNNEISDLRLIVYEAQRLLRENLDGDPIRSGTRTFADEVMPILIRGRDKLLELESLIEHSLIAPGTSVSSKPKVRKIAWVRKQQKVQDIKDEIRSFRMNLTAILGLVASKTTSRVELRISQIQIDSDTLHSRLDSALPEIIGNQTRSTDLLDNLLRSFTASHEASSTDSSALLVEEQSRTITQKNVIPGLQIHLARTLDSCSLDCYCACHSRSAWRSPRYLRFFLGTLFTGYTGLPILSPRCDVVECIQSSQSTIYFKYFFPPWMLARVVEHYIRISRSYGISQCLRVSNVVQSGAPIFLLARFGDTEGLKKLLNSRRASPFDVSLDGTTALQNTLFVKSISTVRLLLDAGSDPYVEDLRHRTPYEIAWSAIMTSKLGDPVAAALRSMFPDPDLDNFRFTPIHKVVLSLSSVSLIQAIGLCPKGALNQSDGKDKTPLMWAAHRGDLPTMKSLLLNGADPNKSSSQESALYYAARSGSYDCVKMLLQHGVDPNLRPQDNYGPLIGLINSLTDNVTILVLLNAYKANINKVGISSGSPLTLAIDYRQQQIATKLIHLGADIHHREKDGTNSLYMATYYNLHAIVRLLLDRGGDHTGVVQDPYGSYLHLIAHSADGQTLKLLTNALAPRDIYYKRQDGMTAMDAARVRSDVDSSWHNAFSTFIGSVYQPKMTSAVMEDDTLNEVFSDALEHQPSSSL